MNKCTLQKELNSCQYLLGDNICIRPIPHKCSMLDGVYQPKSQNTYVRKERWYEKYYRGSK